MTSFMVNLAQQSLDLSLLTTAELHHLLEEWNQTQANYPKNLCIHQWIELQVELTPDRVAVIFVDEQLTYRELNHRANQLAHYLRTLNVEPEVLVGICLERSLNLLIGLLGILKAGGAYVPLDPAYPQERLGLILEDSQLSVLLTQKNLLEQLPKHQAQVVCIDVDEEIIAQHSKENPKTGVNPENLAYILYTSGSTGKPKGVQIEHCCVVNFLNSMRKQPGLTESDILLAVTTICFDIAGLELYLPLIVGAQIVLARREVTSHAEQLSKLLAESGATVMQATPATWRLLLAAGWQGNKQLKILCGGEALTPGLANQLQELVNSVWNMYGPTETTIWSAVYKVEPENNRVPIGRPIDNTQIYLVDPHSEPLKPIPIGTPGELLIGGDGLARGYRNRPELNREKFIPNPFSNKPGERLYRTGDLARYLPDGKIEFIGRIDHQVKIRGFRIELGDIEAALSQHPGVREAVVVAREDNPGDRRLVAYLVTELNVEGMVERDNSSALTLTASETQGLSLTHLRSFLQAKLPEYMIPSAFVLMDSLPLTPNGKVDRSSLPAPNQDRPVLNEAFVAPHTEVERQLAQIWTRVLGIETVGIHDNFFELGGNSLLLVQMLARVRETLQVELPLLNLLQAPTIAGLVEAIQGRGNPTDLYAEASLDETIRPDTISSQSITEPQRFLLTGSTGFIGAFLLRELLQEFPKASIYCLVRAASAEVGKQKIRQNLERYLLWNDELNSRIIPVVGDLSKPFLGLNEQLFSELAREIDVIYHNGAFVNLIYPYAALRATNVLGTQEILRLASQIKVKPVHFISTLDVFQSSTYHEMKVILESDELDHYEGLSDGYAQSKWVAEKLVMAARKRGIPTCIYRLGTIVGHSQTGASQTNDLISRMLKGFIDLKSAPDLDVTLNLTPVDYVSRAIAHLSKQKASIGKAFHILNPQPLPMRKLVMSINALGYPVQLMTYEQWQTKLLDGDIFQENALSSVVSLFTEKISPKQQTYLEISALVSQTYDYQNTLDGLAGTSIICPPVNFKLLSTYFSYYTCSGFLTIPICCQAFP
ncbi:non-ribosomal peptide synthetase family protein [Fischerella sp. PCC 9605]|uniref:non-ribosomal peptide synthetase family protein n=1 Tax=Fischerella sp. PCC 9605 TaxID=1173024 RepID=UPI0004B55358|nr:thioester reductase domain-containing protein [Fischerella sp. PCC 9605]